MTKEEITICKMYLEEMGKDKDCNEYKLLMQMLEQQPIAEERYQDLVEYFSDKDVAKCVLEDKEEFKKWLERIKWYVRKADELARKLEQPTSEDCVSRAEAIEAITEWWSDTLENTIIEKDPIDVLNSLPPVTPTRKVGKWIQISGGCKCPFCDMAFSRLKEDCSDSFCPECGADMRGESNND